MPDNIYAPHFDLPFKFGADGHAKVVDQDTDEDVMNCVSAIVRTTKGTRLFVPEFGITDPTFSQMPIDEARLSSEITVNEPRADANSISQVINSPDLSSVISVGIGSIGQ